MIPRLLSAPQASRHGHSASVSWRLVHLRIQSLRSQVYPLYAFGAALDARQHLAQWGSCCVRVDGSSGHVREKGMKDHVVSRLKRRISHSEPRTLLRRVFANCTAANPPPITTTADWLHSLLLLLAWVRLKVEFPWPSVTAMPKKRRLDALVQDREKGILRISESCELYSK